MTPFEITILGSNSAVPTPTRHPTSQLLNINHHYYLIDCGEGAQIQMRKFGIKFQRIEHIFISHLHGDHYFGLIGLLNTMHLLGRESTLTIHANRMLREILNLQLSVSNTKLKYEIHYNYLDDETESVILKDHNVEVTATPVDHRIPCFGFIFRETEKPLNIKKDSLQSFKLGVEEIKLLKQGKDIHRAKETIYAADATEAPLSLRKYAFITDTKPKDSYYEAIKDSDILYHESTFMGDAAQRAADTFHTTNLQAAEIALKTNCKKLVLGHFSTRYTQLEPIKAEAQTIFENTELAIEGKTFKIER